MSSPADNTELCPVCGLAPHVHGCTPGKCRAPQAPLPWRWGTVTDGKTTVEGLLDANDNLIVLPVPGRVLCATAYVRAVTERAKALELVVRDDVAKDVVEGKDTGECEDAYNDKLRTPSAVPSPWESYCGDTCVACRARALLAEIDAAKASG